MKLATKLIILFLLLTTIPLAGVGYLAFDNGRRTIEQNVLNHLISTNIFKEGEFDRWVKDSERMLRELARRPLVREYTAVLASLDQAVPEYQAVHRSLHEDHLTPTLEEEGGFLDLFILRGSDGLILVSTDERQEGKYRESAPYFVEGKSRTYVQNVYYSLTLAEAAMTISTPVKDREGNLIVVLAGHADLTEMSDIMEQRSGLSATEDTYLVNTFNFFVTEPRFGEGYALKKAVRTEGVQACLEHNEGIGFYDDYRGVPVIGAYRWMPERELCIQTEVDQAEAYAPVVALRNTVLGIGIAVALVVALLGVLFARTITGPVRQLVRGAGEIGRGNLDYQIGVRGRDEIGQLATAFNDMAAKRKQAEQALQESEQWLSTTLRSIGDAVIATDAKGLVSLMNPVARDLTGWDKAETVGKPLEDVFNIVNEQTGERAENPVARVLREGVVVGLANHTVLIAKDGTRRPIADSGAPMRDEEGNIIGTVMVFRDITERKQTEEELRKHRDHLEELVEQRSKALWESEEQFRILAERSPNMIFINKKGRVVYANERCEEAMGYTREEFYSPDFDFLTLIAPEHKDLIKASFGRHMRGEEAPSCEYALLTKEGRRIEAILATRLIRYGGETAILGIATDITERKRAEEALKEYSERLEEMVEERTKELREAQEQLVRRERLAVLGQLAGGVGHELRNPLGAIKNAAYFLNMVIEDPDREVKETLDILDKEVGTSERIISSLLDFARTKPPVRRKVDVNDIVQDALSRTTVPENVEVVSQLDETLPTILADPDQLVQVFGNLILNGAQAMPGGGQLVVTSEAPGPEWVAVSITDTGVGISKENLAKIFEPLFTTKAKGIGLGLAVVKTLVEGHGGSIEVTSEVGKGSTFTVRLPNKGAEEQGARERGAEGALDSRCVKTPQHAAHTTFHG